MKLHKNSQKQGALATICAGVLAVFATHEANAQSFGVSFIGNGSVSVTGTAGVVPISNWNNINGSTFTAGTLTANDGTTTAAMTLSGASAAGSWNSGSTADGGNGSLVNGYIDSGANTAGGSPGSAISTISGLTGSVYNIFIYIYSDATHPANGGDLLPNYSINGTTYYAAQLGNGTSGYTIGASTVGGAFTGFVRATTFGANTTNAPAASAFGNYIEIDNVAPVSGAITIASEADSTSWRSPLDGFQIQVAAVPEPTTMALSVAGLAMLGLIRRKK